MQAQTAIMASAAVLGAAVVVTLLTLFFVSDPWYVMNVPYSVSSDIADGELEYLVTLRHGYDAADVRNGTVIYTDGKRWGALNIADKRSIPFGETALTFDAEGTVIQTETPYTQADRRGKDYTLWRQDGLLGTKSTNSYLEAYEVGDAVIVVVNGEQNVYAGTE